jgi:chaperonin GroEL
MIADAMKKVGNEGVITVEEAKTADTESMSSRACSSTARDDRGRHACWAISTLGG